MERPSLISPAEHEKIFLATPPLVWLRAEEAFPVQEMSTSGRVEIPDVLMDGIAHEDGGAALGGLRRNPS